MQLLTEVAHQGIGVLVTGRVVLEFLQAILESPQALKVLPFERANPDFGVVEVGEDLGPACLQEAFVRLLELLCRVCAYLGPIEHHEDVAMVLDRAVVAVLQALRVHRVEEVLPAHRLQVQAPLDPAVVELANGQVERVTVLGQFSRRREKDADAARMLHELSPDLHELWSTMLRSTGRVDALPQSCPSMIGRGA